MMVFGLTNGPMGKSYAFTNVMKLSPTGPVAPIPNEGVSAFVIPTQFHVISGGALVLNMASSAPVSMGDFSGIGMGVVSNTVASMQRHTTGNFTVLAGGSPMVSTGKLTQQNMINSIGTAGLIPSQVRHLVLAL